MAPHNAARHTRESHLFVYQTNTFNCNRILTKQKTKQREKKYEHDWAKVQVGLGQDKSVVHSSSHRI